MTERSLRMKNWVKKWLFSMRVAWRNMRVHPFRTILLLIGFLGVSMTVMLAISMTDIFHTYFYGDLAEMYQDIDLKITVDDGSQTRFFSITPLNNSNMNQLTDGIYPFFEYEALVEVTPEDRDYVRVFASSTAMLNHLSDDQNIIARSLTENEVIITSTYALHHVLSVRDNLTLTISDQTKAFRIVDVLTDGKLFYGESIFIDKQASLTFFLTALDPSLASLPSSLLTNIYNTLYVDIKDDIRYQDVVDAFKAISSYNLLSYTKTIDEVSVNQLVQRNTSLLSGLISFVFVAIILVLQTTLKYYFLDRKRQTTMIHILGGKTRYGLSILAIELLIVQIIAFILAVIFVNGSIRFGMNYLESAWIYTLTIDKVFITLAITFVIFFVMFGYYSYRSKTMADMNEMRMGGDERQLNWKYQISISLSSLVLFGLLYIPKIANLLGHNASIIRVILGTIFLLFIAPLGLYACMLLFEKNKEKKKTYYHLRILTSKKGFSHYFSVTLIVSLVIFLLIFMMQHLNQRIETIENEYDFDFIVTRLLSDQNTIKQEIEDLDNVSSVDRADIYENVVVTAQNVNINYVMSMQNTKIDTYFNMPDLANAIELLDQETIPAIILPISYHEIYRYHVQDQIELSFGNAFPYETFVIAGFFEKQGMGVAFTNLYTIDFDIKTNANSMLVKANGDRAILMNQLLDMYSNEMIIIFDFWDNYLGPFIFAMVRVKNFIIGYLSLVMICFIMTLANHQTMMQIEREADDARMLVIGYQQKDLQKETIIEGIMILGVVLITSIITFILIVMQIEGLFAAFGAYENVIFKPLSIWIGTGINVLLFTMMWLSRMKRQPNIHLIDYIRTY